MDTVAFVNYKNVSTLLKVLIQKFNNIISIVHVFMLVTPMNYHKLSRPIIIKPTCTLTG